MTDALIEGIAASEMGYNVSTPGAVVASSSVPFDGESEEALALRYGRARRKSIQKNLIFEFTRDPALLHQYYGIYEEQFRAVHNATRYSHSEEDEHDRHGHIVVARIGNQCVGGARLSVKTPRQPHLLPVELNDFRLEHHFPELAQKQMRYGQVGRFCLLPDFRGGQNTRMLLWHLYRKAAALNLDIIFGTAPMSNARVYLQNFAAMNLKEPKLHQDIELPRYPMCEEIKFYLVSLDMHKQDMGKKDSAEEKPARKPEKTSA